MTLDVPVFDDPRDRRIAAAAEGLLHDLNVAGVLESPDVHVAVRLGALAEETDEQVLLAVALTVRAVRSGSVCLDLATVPAIAPDLTFPAAGPWRAAVAASRLLDREVLHLDRDLLYLDRYWAEELQVVADLQARASSGTSAPVDEGVLTEALAAYFPDERYADQRDAAATAVRHRTSVITGGPGTGKTATVARLLGVLMHVHAATGEGDRPLRIALAAPTGKAAARMVQAVRESTSQRGFPRDGDQAGRAVTTIGALQASTLHRLLGWTPNSTRFRHDRGNRLPYDVVVVDETSMLSLTMMARLLEAVRPSARLVLVGDADQLASVDAGAVLKDLVDGYTKAAPAVPEPVGSSPVARLSESRRFGERIGALATAVRDGEVEAVLDELRAGSEEVAWTDVDDLPALLTERAVALREAAGSGDGAQALEELDRHRLLCAHRDGLSGVSHWNRLVERLLMEATGSDYLREWYLGRPFVVNTNDYGLSLWNGDTGVTCRVDGGLVAVVGDAGTGRVLPTSRLADVTTAHAMTVHRSQGSQFDEVTVLLPEEDSRILTRELLYTAVTRARSRVRIVGTEDALRAAVTRRAQRATGLADRLLG